MRTRLLPKLLNSEVEQYLESKDIIIVPVGTIEVHGGMPLDSETVIGEALALKMAEACDGLALTGLPYFYAGATAIGRGTVQVSIKQGIEYLTAIAHSLLRQGFRRQIYISFHGPAHMTCSPMVRDFYDETGAPILYIDTVMEIMSHAKELFTSMDSFHAITVGAYKIMGRLEDVPLTCDYAHNEPSTVQQFNRIFGKAYQSGSVGYYFGDTKDHMSTTAIPDEETRERLAEEGIKIINGIVTNLNMPQIVQDLRELDLHQQELAKTHPWLPTAYNAKK